MIKLVGETREVNSPLNSQRLVSDEWLTGSSVWRYPFPLMVDMGSNRISLDRTSLRFDQYVIKKVHLIVYLCWYCSYFLVKLGAVHLP